MDNSPYGTFADPAANGSAHGQATNQGIRAETPNEEIQHIASAIEELQGRLARANEQLNHVAAVQKTEIEIGRLFVEAQRFSEEALSQLEVQVQEVVLEAETKAAEIIREATAEAQEIRRHAQEGSLPAHTAQELKSVIGAFASVNAELIQQINTLNAMLTPLVDRRTASFGQPPTPMRSL